MEERSGATSGYILYGEIAAGGMAAVHLGRLVGSGGFARTVAIKRLHPHLGADPAFATMFLEEARLVARIRHANVVPTLDVVSAQGEAFLVMEYVHGEPLSALARFAREQGERLPSPIVCAILENVLAGLHAAHEARSDAGEPLGIVHRDVSPQNILVGVDGIARLLDFGVAKAKRRYEESTGNSMKGKLAYMTPEQVELRPVDRRSDIFSAGIVLWEMLTGERLFAAPDPVATVAKIIGGRIPPPSELGAETSSALDAVVLRALERDSARRFATALEMRAALEQATRAASALVVGEWVESTARASLAARAARVAEIECGAALAIARVNRAGLIGVAGGSEALTEVSLSLAVDPPAATTTPMAPPSPGVRRKRVLAVATALLAIAGAAAALVGFRSSSTAGASPAIDVASVPSSAEAPPPVEIAPVAPAAPPPSSSSPPPLAAPSASSLAPRARIPASAPAPRAKALSCSPNFSIDDRGIKHLKPECL